MGYDVWLECPCCKLQIDERSFNYTSNISKMLHDKDVCIYIKEWHDKPAKLIVKELESGIARLEANPDKFIAMNPENGWGSYNGLLKYFLKPLLEACKNHPNTTVKVWV